MTCRGCSCSAITVAKIVSSHLRFRKCRRPRPNLFAGPTAPTCKQRIVRRHHPSRQPNTSDIHLSGTRSAIDVCVRRTTPTMRPPCGANSGFRPAATVYHNWPVLGERDQASPVFTPDQRTHTGRDSTVSATFAQARLMARPMRLLKSSVHNLMVTTAPRPSSKNLPAMASYVYMPPPPDLRASSPLVLAFFGGAMFMLAFKSALSGLSTQG